MSSTHTICLVQFRFHHFLGSGPGGYRRGRSPVEYRGNLYVRLYVRTYVRPYVRPSPPPGTSEAGQGLPM